MLDYANAMVASKQFTSASDAESKWQEHVDGKPQYGPPILPLAPAKFTGSLYITKGSQPLSECAKFLGSLEDTTGNYVQSVIPKISGATPGMLGYMFWASECPSGRSVCTTPPNDCLNGVGRGSSVYNVFPMPTLRQNCSWTTSFSRSTQHRKRKPSRSTRTFAISEVRLTKAGI